MPLPRSHQDDGCEIVEALSGLRAAAERFHLDHKMNKLSIRDLDMKGQRVFIRVDFNVPLDGGKVADDTRIRETLPTLQLAIDRGARLVLASHLGRPKGKVDPKYSLAPVAARLQELLGKPVEFVVRLRWA